MFMSGNTAAGNNVTVAGRSWWLLWEKYWLPHITDWKFEADYLAYNIINNISDYTVAKRG